MVDLTVTHPIMHARMIWICAGDLFRCRSIGYYRMNVLKYEMMCMMAGTSTLPEEPDDFYSPQTKTRLIHAHSADVTAAPCGLVALASFQ